MITEPKLMFGKVMHKRLVPKINTFTYGTYYLAFPLSQVEKMPMAINRPGIFSFYDKDHGPRDGSNLKKWIRGILISQGVLGADGEVILVTMPRVLEYVFNPVSFWLCLDCVGGLRAVLCEVNNTFGERHNYICMHSDRRVIHAGDWIEGEKVFHVSPFLKTEGTYRFRFHLDDKRFGAWIDHTDVEGHKKLLTSLSGRFAPMSRQALRYAFWRYPLLTFMVIFLIHWQAAKLYVKGVCYVPKPMQRQDKLTAAQNITEM